MWQQECLVEIMDNPMDTCDIVCDQESCDTPKVSKLKLQSEKREKDNSTPVTAICESLSKTVIETENRSIIEKNEPGETPVPSQLQAPVQSHSEVHIPSPIQISKQNQHIPFSIPACSTPLKPLVEVVLNSTPRRNPRRSCSGRYTICANINDETSSNCSAGNAMHLPSVLPIFSRVGDADKFTDLNTLHDKEANVSNCDREKELSNPTLANCHISNNNISDTFSDEYVISKDQRCHKRSSLNNILKSKILSEPRPKIRKSDIGVASSRKLCFSSKRPSLKKKNIIEEYDPDNDIFAHGVVPTHFNIDSLKNEIGKFLSSSDVSPSKLVRSQSCGALNMEDCEEDTSIQCSSPKRRSKSITRSPRKDTFKRALSAPNLLETVSSVTNPSPDPPKEGTVRAFLRARDIIMNIHKRKVCHDKVTKEPGVSNAKNCDNSTDEQLSNSLKFDESCGKGDNVSFEMNNSVSTTDLNSSDFSLLPTQPFESLILKEVTAYVEVISNNENISSGVRKELMKLGATVVPSFNKDVPVTHVVFNDGHISTYKKAKKRNVPLVSVLWIEECRKAGVKVHESLYPPYQIDRYESPNIVKQLKKRKILHSMIDDRPRPSPRRKKGIPKNGSLTTSNEPPPKIVSICRRSSVPKWVDQVAGDNGMVRILVNMTGVGPGEFKDIVKRPPTPDSDTESNLDSPLAVRLLRKLAKNVDISCNINDVNVSQKNNISSDVISSSQTIISKNNSDITENEIPKTEDNVIFEGLNVGNVSSKNPVPSLINVTRRKKNSKKRLLSTADETLSVSDDGRVCGPVINPHVSSSKNSDSIGKKRKANSSTCLQDTGESLGSNPKEGRDLDKQGNDNYPLRRSRRSSAYFVNKDDKTQVIQVSRKPAIVCSLLHSVEVDVVASIIEKLGVYVLERSITSHTTHIVTGAAKRTMKVLKGMVRGCWIVSHEWVLKSLEAGKWLDEEEFEMTSFSPALQKYRLEKLSFGATFKPDIFGSCGPIFVSSKSSAPRGDLVELILLCGGRIVSRVGRAAIVVGKKHPGVQCVNALWVLDSITVYYCKPFDSYLFS